MTETLNEKEINTNLSGTYLLPLDSTEDLDELRQIVALFKAGKMSELEFRALRVPRGVYEQRESGTFMLRIRVPGGAVLPHQLRQAAKVAKDYGDGVLHVTTRQDLQVHRVPLDNISPALEALLKAGLSTKGGGGNTVRNITGCYDAGVCPREVFDVSPYPIGLTEFLIGQPSSYELPRKYKIGFSGCDRDCAGAVMQDLGFIAKRSGLKESFAVYAGGGMGANSRLADLLEECVPVSEAHLVAEAVKRVFDKHGNRKNKHKARLRFLVEKLGLAEFRRLYKQELAELKQNPPAPPEYRPIPQIPPKPKVTAKEKGIPTEGFDRWRQLCVVPQKQSGFNLVLVPLLLGDLDFETASAIADIIEQHGERMLRTTNRQDAVIRWVHDDELLDVYNKLVAAGLADLRRPAFRDIVSCTGASTCRLGICLSRGLAKAIAEKMTESDLGLNGTPVEINISGCPNSCGRHQVAAIGLFGAVRRVEGRMMPHYFIQLGGQVGESKARLAIGKNVIPAKNIPSMIVDLLKEFKASVQYPDFGAFLENGGWHVADELAGKYKAAPTFEENPDYYSDWGSNEMFSLTGRGSSECSAGMYDLIEMDMANAAESLGQNNRYAAVALVCRALLITRGQVSRDDVDAFALFRKHFIEQRLVDEVHGPMIADAIDAASNEDPSASFNATSNQVASLIEAARELLDQMGPSLRPPATNTSSRERLHPAVDKELDCRGIACPVNYVKTKIALDEIGTGQTLCVLLDAEGSRSVSASIEADGQKVVALTQEGDYWRVLIEKRIG